ncbi:N-(5'-phosphoribosyl)anthranilate isomerase [Streptomyces cucumeris]|uniref:phosphoribosylanthranilate isomerase n=1 Tax=Streptomyces cucumeris TaxID=2962890 RepID=UPI003D7638FA
MLLKVCGVTDVHQLRRMSCFPVELAGLWYGVPGGRWDLSLERFAGLAAAARAMAVEPVLVTLLDDPVRLREAVDASGVRWVQLHGYPAPAGVRRIRAALPDVTLVKVVHVREGKAVEEPFADAYRRAGADLFLFDSVGDDGRVGSTGTPLDPGAAARVLDRAELPFLLAGGISADGAERYDALLGHSGFRGLDVDSALRGGDGTLRLSRVDALSAAWRLRRETVRCAS